MYRITTSIEHTSYCHSAGDGSASYLWDMRRWWEYFDPDDPNAQLFLPHVIKTVTPKAKLIAAFREPVAR